MPEIDQESKDNLRTCHKDLQLLFGEVAKHCELEVLEGFIDAEHQSMRGVPWGEKPQNFNPSLAAVVMPKPTDWDNRDRILRFSGIVEGIALRMCKTIRYEFPNRYILVGDYKHVKLFD